MGLAAVREGGNKSDPSDYVTKVHLQEGHMSSLSPADCEAVISAKSTFFPTWKLGKTECCAVGTVVEDGKTTASCSGDSGGPIFYKGSKWQKDRQYALSSWVSRRRAEHAAGVALGWQLWQLWQEPCRESLRSEVPDPLSTPSFPPSPLTSLPWPFSPGLQPLRRRGRPHGARDRGEAQEVDHEDHPGSGPRLVPGPLGGQVERRAGPISTPPHNIV